jgi:putative PIN family toxin of toxin-antitoxin system
MLRATLDTNVLLSAFRSRQGAAFELLRRLRAGHWRLVLSNTTLAEYEEVLKRESTSLKLSLAEIDRALDALCRLAEQWHPSGNWTPLLTDPDDESFVQLTFEARADALVTFNLRHFAPARVQGISVMTPAGFLAMLGSAP